MHQVRADDSAGDGPRRELLQRSRVQSSPARLAHQQPRREEDARRREDAKRLQRNRADPQGRNDEVRNQLTVIPWRVCRSRCTFNNMDMNQMMGGMWLFWVLATIALILAIAVLLRSLARR